MGPELPAPPPSPEEPPDDPPDEPPDEPLGISPPDDPPGMPPPDEPPGMPPPDESPEEPPDEPPGMPPPGRLTPPPPELPLLPPLISIDAHPVTKNAAARNKAQAFGNDTRNVFRWVKFMVISLFGQSNSESVCFRYPFTGLSDYRSLCSVAMTIIRVISAINT
jgi:hypothetical protein